MYNLQDYISVSSNYKDIKNTYSSCSFKVCYNGSVVFSHTFISLTCQSRDNLKR